MDHNFEGFIILRFTKGTGPYNVTLFSETHTLKNLYEYTEIKCVGVAKECYIKRAPSLNRKLCTDKK